MKIQRLVVVILGLLSLSTVAICIYYHSFFPPPDPDVYPPGTPVKLTIHEARHEETFELGPKSRQQFLDMLAHRPAVDNEPNGGFGGFNSIIPLGIFTVGEKDNKFGSTDYILNGCKVFCRKRPGRDVLCWRGSFVENLYVKLRQLESLNQESIQRILDELEQHAGEP